MGPLVSLCARFPAHPCAQLHLHWEVPSPLLVLNLHRGCSIAGNAADLAEEKSKVKKMNLPTAGGTAGAFGKHKQQPDAGQDPPAWENLVKPQPTMQCPHHPMCKTVTGLGPRLGWRGNKRQWGGDFPVIRSSRSTGPHIFNFGMCREVQGSGEKGEQNSSRAEKLPAGSRCLHRIPNCIPYPIPHYIP